jgi:membrane fusion protein (multidrug efflux system)
MASSRKSGAPDQADGLLRRNRVLLMIAGPVLIIGLVGLFWYLGLSSETTDDAYVQAARLPISASIGGRVVELAVSENQPVKAGQILFKIDSSDYSVNVEGARAKLADARLRALSLSATYRQQQINLSALQTTLDFAVREAARQEKMVAAGVSSRQDAEAAAHAVDSARAQLAIARQQAAVALANLGGRPDAPESFPAVLQARADLQRAGISLGNTVVTAPSDGVVTRVEQLQVGAYVNAAQTVFWLVSGAPWVEANFKENQLGKMKVGQPVEIEVDAFSGRTFAGRVASFSPGTGAAFAPLPAQNATGNWVKVVQRLPVRIAFDGRPPEMAGRIGLSAHVKVDVSAPGQP